MDKDTAKSRLGSVGGAAVIEGVMMKSKTYTALAVRRADGGIATERQTNHSVAEKYAFCKWPIIRGVVNFVEQMILTYKTLDRSVELVGIEEEESKFEKFLKEKLGKSMADVASFIGIVLGLALSVGLFVALPAFVSDMFEKYVSDVRFLKSVVDGLSKIAIFVGYIALVTLIPDMKRTFMYHGAEHKSIFCHEAGLELTVENVKKQSRFHPRCGTSFLFVMMFIGIFVSVLYVGLPLAVRIPVKILMIPLIVGLGYEFIRYAGRHDNVLVRVLSAPGLWVQRLTTKEPTDDMMEVAIASLKKALPDVYPEEPGAPEEIPEKKPEGEAPENG